MKKPTSFQLIERIQRLGPEMGGVFTHADLSNLIGTRSPLQNNRIIARLARDGVLVRIQRGFYTTQKPDLWVLASRLRPDAVISMESVLAKEGLIGTIPEGIVSSIYPSTKRMFIETPFGLIRFFSIQKKLLFGISRMKNGVAIADKEKAFLDVLYFYTKGTTFVMDPITEINTRKLDRKKIETYLKRYKNPKFVTFVKGVLNANT